MKYIVIIMFFFTQLILYSAECIIFPFNNKILAFDCQKDLLFDFKTTHKIFLKDFFYKDQQYFFIEQQAEELILTKLENEQLVPIFSNISSQMILTKNFLLTVSKYTDQKANFKFTIYTMQTNEKKIKLNIFTSFVLELIVSDYEIFDDNIFLSGIDIGNHYNYVYLINIAENFCKLIFKAKKNNDFFKLSRDDHRLYIYNSSKPSGNSVKKIWYFDLSNQLIDDPKKLPSLNENTYHSPEYFFGKGFTYYNALWLPVINQKNETFLYQFSHDLKIINKIKISTGIYKELKIIGTNLYAIGYNYYKQPAQFYLLIFNLSSLNEYKLIPLQ